MCNSGSSNGAMTQAAENANQTQQGLERQQGNSWISTIFQPSEHQLKTRELEQNNPNALILHESGGGQSGSENLAKVARAEWEDYKSRFAPIEDKLFERFNDDEGRAVAADKAASNAGLALDRSKEQTDRTFSRYGLNMTDRQNASRDKAHSLQKTASTVGAKNTTRAAKEEQRMNIMAGGLNTSRT